MLKNSLFLFFLISLCAKISLASNPAISIAVQDTTVSSREVLLYDDGIVTKNELDKTAIENYKTDKDFNYKEQLPEDTWWTRFKQKLSDLWNSFLSWLFDGEEATGFLAVLVRLLPYLLLAGFIAFLVWVFLKIDSGTLMGGNIKAPTTLLSDDEELIQHQDLQSLIDQALAEGNYRLAVRFYYLLTLQKLSNKDLIDWESQKTNHEYIFEINDTTLRNQFRKVTDVYDYIWYGSFDVDESAFAKAEKSFLKLSEQL